MDTFDKLPIEVTRLILRQFDFQSKLSARSVCWVWNDIIDECMRFKVLLTKDNLQYFGTLYDRVHTLTIRNLNVSIHGELSKLKSGERSIIAKSPKILIFDSSNNEGTYGKNISTVLKLNTTMEYLEFRKNSLRFIYKPISVDGVIMDNLKELKLKVGHTFHMKIASGLAKLLMPKLKLLTLVCAASFNCQSGKLNSRVYFDFYRFFLHCVSSLDKLELVHPKTHKYKYDLFEHAIDHRELVELTKAVQEKQKKLTELKIEFAAIENKRGFGNLGLQLSLAQKNLTKVELKIIGQSCQNECHEIIRQNSATLSTINVTYTTYKMDFSHFDCEVLSSCKRLEHLKIHNFYILHPEQLPRGLKTWSTFGSFIQNPLEEISNHFTELTELVFLPYEWETYNNINFLQAFEELLKLPKLTRFEVFSPHIGTVLEALFWSHNLITLLCPSSLDLRNYFLKIPNFRGYRKDLLMPTIIALLNKDNSK